MSNRQPCPAGVDHTQPGAALTVRQREQLRKFARAGKTTRWLASHFGVSTVKVRRALQPLRPRKIPAPELSPPPPNEPVAVAS